MLRSLSPYSKGRRFETTCRPVTVSQKVQGESLPASVDPGKGKNEVTTAILVYIFSRPFKLCAETNTLAS